MEMFGHQYHILYLVFHELGLALIFDVKSVSHIFGLDSSFQDQIKYCLHS